MAVPSDPVAGSSPIVPLGPRQRDMVATAGLCPTDDTRRRAAATEEVEQLMGCDSESKEAAEKLHRSSSVSSFFGLIPVPTFFRRPAEEPTLTVTLTGKHMWLI